MFYNGYFVNQLVDYFSLKETVVGSIPTEAARLVERPNPLLPNLTKSLPCGQVVRRSAVNRCTVGSNPTGGANKSEGEYIG